jgi:hypothetical protein
MVREKRSSVRKQYHVGVRTHVTAGDNRSLFYGRGENVGPDYAGRERYVEGFQNDPEQRHFTNYGANKNAAIKAASKAEMEKELVEFWGNSKGYSKQLTDDRDPVLKEVYRKQKTTRSKKPVSKKPVRKVVVKRKVVKRCK